MKLPDRNEKYQQILLYVLLGAFCILVMLFLLINIGVIVPKGMSFISTFFSLISPFIVGLAIVYLLNPIVNQIEKMLYKSLGIIFKKKKDRMSFRGLSVLITYLIVAGCIFLILSVIISSVANEIKLADTDSLKNIALSLLSSGKEFIKGIASKLEQFGIKSANISEYQQKLLDWINSSTTDIATGAFSFVSNVGNAISKFLIAMVLSIYVLIDLDNLKKYWQKAAAALLRNRSYGALSTFLKDADDCFSGYIKGQFLDACVMAVLVSVGLSIVNVKYSVLIGILTGIGNLIPYVGPIFAYGGTILACVVDGDFKKMLIGLIVVLVIQGLDGNFINPKLLSNSISVNPILVIIALLIGASTGGLMGMLVAVPVAALVKKEFDRFIAWREAKKLEKSGEMQ
ncbi:pheromone autoinducer 2 transporter [[Eubacterium] infirmum]|mgnify:FL=1|nr:pheromone autoinducer 2 transporter [[Eubacterium] infirmum]